MALCSYFWIQHVTVRDRLEWLVSCDRLPIVA